MTASGLDSTLDQLSEATSDEYLRPCIENKKTQTGTHRRTGGYFWICSTLVRSVLLRLSVPVTSIGEKYLGRCVQRVSLGSYFPC